MVFALTSYLTPAPVGAPFPDPISGTSIYSVVTFGAQGNGRADDTAAIQRAIDAAAVTGGTVYLSAGRYMVSALIGAGNVSIVGAGRESTAIKARVDNTTLLTISRPRTAGPLEVPDAATIEDVAFDGNGHSGNIGVSWVGVAFFNVARSTFRALETGVAFHGSLQGRVDDTKFLLNRTGLRFSAEAIEGFTAFPVLPPNRVAVTWSAFYGNTYRAIDYSGGEQLIIRDTELGDNGTEGDEDSAAIWFVGSGDTLGPGLVASGLWMESNHGYAAINIAASSSILRHSITDSWLAYTDATHGIAVDGSSAATTLLAERVSMDTAHTTRTFYRVGPNVVLDLRNCTGVLSGWGGVVRQDPTLHKTASPRS